MPARRVQPWTRLAPNSLRFGGSGFNPPQPELYSCFLQQLRERRLVVNPNGGIIFHRLRHQQPALTARPQRRQPAEDLIGESATSDIVRDENSFVFNFLAVASLTVNFASWQRLYCPLEPG